MASRNGVGTAAATAALLIATWSGAAGAQTPTRVSVDSAGGQGNSFSLRVATSADGGVVVFESFATNLVPFDTNGSLDVFVHDVVSGTTERVSVDSFGNEGDDASSGASISADGRYVVFTSYSGLLVAGDTNGVPDVFIHDRTSGATDRVSVASSGAQANDWSDHAVISADGSAVAFTSKATNLVAGDHNNWEDVFVRDLVYGTIERVSVDSSGNEVLGNSDGPALSSDGRLVLFVSDASTLVAGDANGVADLFVHDGATAVTERVSVDSSGAEADGPSFAGSITADGQLVAFASAAANLVAGDTNGADDLFVHDRASGASERVSVHSSGQQGDGGSEHGSLSADGRWVVFDSSATNLVDGDGNRSADVFVHDRSTGTTDRVSIDASGTEGDNDSTFGAISADGQIVVFSSYADDLVAGDTNAVSDAFRFERCSAPASWSNCGAGLAGTHGVPAFTSVQPPALGVTITLSLTNSYGRPTLGVLFAGFQRTKVHSSWGGDLLVVPAITFQISFSFGSDSFTGPIPLDPALCGVAIDLQAIESDPGAVKGVSFTPGLGLILGR